MIKTKILKKKDRFGPVRSGPIPLRTPTMYFYPLQWWSLSILRYQNSGYFKMLTTTELLIWTMKFYLNVDSVKRGGKHAETNKNSEE